MNYQPRHQSHSECLVHVVSVGHVHNPEAVYLQMKCTTHGGEFRLSMVDVPELATLTIDLDHHGSRAFGHAEYIAGLMGVVHELNMKNGAFDD